MTDKRHQKWWDEDKVKELYTLWQAGLNDAEIAEKLGASPAAVTHARHKNGMINNTPPPLTDAEKKTICELGPTHTCDEIAAIIGRSRSTVDHYARDNGIMVKMQVRSQPKAKRKPKDKSAYCKGLIREYTYDTDVLIMQYLSEGYSLARIASILHRSYKDLQAYVASNKDKLMVAHRRMMKYGGVYAARLQRMSRNDTNIEYLKEMLS